MNAVHLVGRVETSPELRHTHGAGQSVVNMLLETHETWRDREGKRQERSDIHRLVFWGRAAEVVAERVQKGDVVGVDGKLQAREYVNGQGVTVRAVEVTVTRVHLIDDASWYNGEEPPEEAQE